MAYFTILEYLWILYGFEINEEWLFNWEHYEINMKDIILEKNRWLLFTYWAYDERHNVCADYSNKEILKRIIKVIEEKFWNMLPSDSDLNDKLFKIMLLTR